MYKAKIGIILSAFHVVSYLVLSTTLWKWYGRYCHFIDEKAEAHVNSFTQSQTARIKENDSTLKDCVNQPARKFYY